MVAEGAFRAQLAQLHVAFEHDLGVRRNFQIDRLALHDLHRLAAQKAGDQELLHLGGAGTMAANVVAGSVPMATATSIREPFNLPSDTCGIPPTARREGRRAAGRLRHHRHASSCALSGSHAVHRSRRAQRLAIVFGGHLLPLPVHACRLAVVDLHPVHADVALARCGIARMHAGQRDEAPAVVRPALENREVVEIEAFAPHDFFARGIFGADGLGKRACQRPQLRQHLQLVEQALGSLHVHQPADALGDLVQPLDAQRQRHAPLTAELVDQNLVPGMPRHVFKQQRRPARQILSIDQGRPSISDRRSLISVFPALLFCSPGR